MKQFEFIENKGWKVSEEDGNVYMSELSPAETYAKEVNDYHNALLDQVLKKYNYISLGELSLWVNDDNLGTEANQIIKWYKSTYNEIVIHLETITDYSDPKEFLVTLQTI